MHVYMYTPARPPSPATLRTPHAPERGSVRLEGALLLPVLALCRRAVTRQAGDALGGRAQPGCALHTFGIAVETGRDMIWTWRVVCELAAVAAEVRACPFLRYGLAPS